MEFDQDNCIMRFGPPSDMDKLPYGTRIKVIKGHQYEIYIQSNTNQETPVWIAMGPFNVEVYDVYPDN